MGTQGEYLYKSYGMLGTLWHRSGTSTMGNMRKVRDNSINFWRHRVWSKSMYRSEECDIHADQKHGENERQVKNSVVKGNRKVSKRLVLEVFLLFARRTLWMICIAYGDDKSCYDGKCSDKYKESNKTQSLWHMLKLLGYTKMSIRRTHERKFDTETMNAD